MEWCNPTSLASLAWENPFASLQSFNYLPNVSMLVHFMLLNTLQIEDPCCPVSIFNPELNTHRICNPVAEQQLTFLGASLLTKALVVVGELVSFPIGVSLKQKQVLGGSCFQVRIKFYFLTPSRPRQQQGRTTSNYCHAKNKKV